MAVVYAPESDYAKELERWNAPKHAGGMNANGYEPYPKMLYKAFRRENGRVMCGDNPLAYRDPQQQLDAESFARSCQMKVHSAEEDARERARGWSESPAEALAAFEAREVAIGDAAAEVNYAVARMSERAQAEKKQADEATSEHVVDLVSNKRKPGRPRVITGSGEA